MVALNIFVTYFILKDSKKLYIYIKNIRNFYAQNSYKLHELGHKGLKLFLLISYKITPFLLF